MPSCPSGRAHLPWSANERGGAFYDGPMAFSPADRAALDDELSHRSIALDPRGYVLIRLDRERGELVAEHYSNGIDDRGRATDPQTGEVIGCRDARPRTPGAIYRGRSAKELGMLLSEGEGPLPLSCLDHAMYLGRELQKAQWALEQGLPYIQD